MSNQVLFDPKLLRIAQKQNDRLCRVLLRGVARRMKELARTEKRLAGGAPYAGAS
jgi:hypothetical protein